MILKLPDANRTTYGLLHIEYVHDNTIMKATNIWNGLRYKIYMDANPQLNRVDTMAGGFTYNFGFDARHYLPIYRNLIWAVRAAGDFSWGSRKTLYYLGGTDGWLFPSAYNLPQPAQDASYAFQTLETTMRGFKQNIANGNNAIVINREIRLPVFSTLFNKPINNAFLRNFQLIQFFDLGTAWNGKYNSLSRPQVNYSDPNSQYLTVQIKAGGIGPFAGSYGFGARSTLLGYFLRFDAGWQMNSFFSNKPVLQVSMGVDF